MTLFKLAADHQVVYDKLMWMSLCDLDTMSPLLVAFACDRSLFFALFVNDVVSSIWSIDSQLGSHLRTVGQFFLYSRFSETLQL